MVLKKVIVKDTILEVSDERLTQLVKAGKVVKVTDDIKEETAPKKTNKK